MQQQTPRWRKWGAFVLSAAAARVGGGSEGERGTGELRAPGRIYRVIIVILVIDYPRTISAAPWLCIPAGVRIYIARNVVYAIPWPDVLRRVVWK